MKKHSLIRSFTILSLITFIITGIILSLIISKHIRDDLFVELKEFTHMIVNEITENYLIETDFDNTISNPKRDELLSHIRETMSYYRPGSLILYNSRSEIILSSEPDANETMRVDDDLIGKMLSSGQQFAKSDVYKTAEPVFNIYILTTRGVKYSGVMVVQIPDIMLSSHVSTLVKSIVIILSIGLFFLFILLIRTLYKASSTLLKQNAEIERSYKNTIYALSSAVDARDPYTAGHSARVTRITVLMCKAMGLSDDNFKNIEYAALFHDIGKIGIPDYILHKDGKLTDDEYEIVKKHPETGISILKSIAFLNKSLPIIKHHHERYDGKGYPDNIIGVEIPIGSRIIAIADTYDAMTSDRPYRKRLSHEVATEEITKNKGLQFDADLVDVFIQIEHKIRK